MSFGLHDEDWVDPDPVEPIKCIDCNKWYECPYCGEEGWCLEFMEFTKWDDGCGD